MDFAGRGCHAACVGALAEGSRHEQECSRERPDRASSCLVVQHGRAVLTPQPPGFAALHTRSAIAAWPSTVGCQYVTSSAAGGFERLTTQRKPELRIEKTTDLERSRLFAAQDVKRELYTPAGCRSRGTRLKMRLDRLRAHGQGRGRREARQLLSPGATCKAARAASMLASGDRIDTIAGSTDGQHQTFTP